MNSPITFLLIIYISYIILNFICWLISHLKIKIINSKIEPLLKVQIMQSNIALIIYSYFPSSEDFLIKILNLNNKTLTEEVCTCCIGLNEPFQSFSNYPLLQSSLKEFSFHWKRYHSLFAIAHSKESAYFHLAIYFISILTCFAINGVLGNANIGFYNSFFNPFLASISSAVFSWILSLYLEIARIKRSFSMHIIFIVVCIVLIIIFTLLTLLQFCAINFCLTESATNQYATLFIVFSLLADIFIHQPIKIFLYFLTIEYFKSSAKVYPVDLLENKLSILREKYDFYFSGKVCDCNSNLDEFKEILLKPFRISPSPKNGSFCFDWTIDYLKTMRIALLLYRNFTFNSNISDVISTLDEHCKLFHKMFSVYFKDANEQCVCILRVLPVSHLSVDIHGNDLLNYYQDSREHCDINLKNLLSTRLSQENLLAKQNVRCSRSISCDYFMLDIHVSCYSDDDDKLNRMNIIEKVCNNEAFYVDDLSPTSLSRLCNLNIACGIVVKKSF